MLRTSEESILYALDSPWLIAQTCPSKSMAMPTKPPLPPPSGTVCLTIIVSVSTA